MNIVKKLHLTFYTDQNKTHTIIMDSPVDVIEELKVKECMDEIIDKEVFATSKGKLTKIKDAKLVERSEVLIDLPA